MTQPDWRWALSAQSEVLAAYTGPYAEQLAKGWLESRNEHYGRAATSPSAAAFAYLIDDLLASEPLFITEEMQSLVYEAMETFDPSEQLHFDDLFLPQGFALLEHPFVATDSNGKLVAWRAISWRYAEVDIRFASESEDTLGEPALRIMLWSHIDDRDDYTDHPEFAEMQDWYRNRGLSWSVAHATTLPLRYANREERISLDGDPKADWLTFFRVTQRLMAETIVAKHERQVERPGWREAKRRGLDLRMVVVVELRREAKPTEAKGGEAHYSHRFIVGSHWRNQWYPSLGVHRQKYIWRYVKGPDDKPLVVKDRVWTWDR